MAKVYVVTSGDYSDYSIDSIFSSREAAEKRCAIWDMEHQLYEPRIEEYDLEDGENIQIDRVYKAIDFCMRHRYSIDKILVDWNILYNYKPFEENIDRCEKIKMRDGRTIELYYGVIPVNKTATTDEEAEKLVYDRLAKWKAEQLGL